MKRIELFWNILYYCTYTLLYSCFCAIDPHRLIDNKYTRKFYKKENIFWQVLDYMKRTEEREKDFSSFILMESIGGTCIFLILLIFTFLNVIMVTTHIPLYSVVFRDVSNFIISFCFLSSCFMFQIKYSYLGTISISPISNNSGKSVLINI